MRCLLTSLLCLLLAGCAVGGQNPPGVGPADDWARAGYADAGLDPARMRALTQDLDAGRFGNVHALLVEHDGRLVHEQYLAGVDENWGQPLGYREFDAGSLHDLRSVSKSVTSLLLGIALGEDHAAALERPVISFFPELADKVAPGVERITLRHLLTMSTGLEWNEMDVSYADPANDGIRLYSSGDPVEFVLTRPLRDDPGANWYYHGGTTMVIAVIIEKLSGKPFLDFASDTLFAPLGIDMSNVEWRGRGLFWKRGPQLPSAGSGLRLRARDLARIGSLVLHDGRWRDRQVVPRGWIEVSLQRHVEQNTPWIIDGIYGYGFQWWHGKFTGDWGTFTAICGLGYGGQRLCVLPDQRLVVTIFAGNYGTGERLVAERLLAAVVAAASRADRVELRPGFARKKIFRG